MKTREDWLCDQLDNDKLSAELRLAYEIELDLLASKYTLSLLKQKELNELKLARLKELRAKIATNDIDFIETFGAQEFGSDYEIIQESTSFVLYSYIARDNQDNRRVHATREAADADLRYLLYNRLYDKYVRSEELETLIELIKL